MKRRTFFWSLAGAAGAVAGLGGFVFNKQSFEAVVENKIIKELSFMKLDVEGVRQFVAAYTRDMTPRGKRSLKTFALMGITTRQSRKINRLMTVYILSTDFFEHGMDESRTVRYVDLYDPRSRPCVNPFSYTHYRTDNA